MNHREMADWIYLGEPWTPMKDYPGVMYVRPRKKKPRQAEDMF